MLSTSFCWWRASSIAVGGCPEDGLEACWPCERRFLREAKLERLNKEKQLERANVTANWTLGYLNRISTKINVMILELYAAEVELCALTNALHVFSLKVRWFESQ